MLISDTNKTIRCFLVFILVAAGFLFRLYAAFNVPLTFDEKEQMIIVKEMTLTKGDINMPLGSEITHHPLLLLYLIKISTSFLGGTVIATRLPSVILGTLTLLVLYFMVKNCLDQKTAMLSLILASFSQFFIGFTRIAKGDGILLFFTASVLFFIQKALHTKKKSFLMAAALFLGLGFLVKTTIATLLPVIIFYIFLYPRNKGLFSLADLFAFLLIILAVMSPSIYWNISHHYADYQWHFSRIEFLSFSLAPIALFFGEIIIHGMRGASDSLITLICSPEYPFLNWLMGFICVAGAAYFLGKRKNNFIALLQWIFYFNFILISFIRPKTGGGYYFHLDNFWWAGVLVIPGLILGAAMLIELSRHYRIAKLILPFLIVYFIINSFVFVRFPANCFVPRDTLKVNELYRTAEDYLQEGKKDKAMKIYKYIARHYPESGAISLIKKKNKNNEN